MTNSAYITNNNRQNECVIIYRKRCVLQKQYLTKQRQNQRVIITASEHRLEGRLARIKNLFEVT